MAQERPTSPEKQLLDLIEDPKEQNLSQKKVKRGSFSLFSLAAMKGRLSFLIDGLRSGSFLKSNFWDIKGLNRILKICIVLLFFYLVGNFVMSVIRLQEVPDFVSKHKRASSPYVSTLGSGKKVSEYLEGPRSRNIFEFGDTYVPVEEVVEEPTDEIAPPVEQSKAEIMAQNLGLVGIGWSDNPDVMITNSESGKMYFLKRGERIDGLIKVEAIFEDRVILTYDNGKELELR